MKQDIIITRGWLLPFVCLCTLTAIGRGAAHDSLDVDATRRSILQSLSMQRAIITEGCHVCYHVTRKVIKPDASFRIQIGCDYNTMALYWRGEHAWRGSKHFDITAARLASQKEEQHLWTLVDDGIRGFRVNPKVPSVHVYQGQDRKTSQNYMLPSEDVYREIIGFESRLQEVGITFRYTSPYTWDLVQVLSDRNYQISKSRLGDAHPELILIERSELERIWLDPARGYAVLRRERRWEPGASMRVVIENSDVCNVGRNVWLPKKAAIQYYCAANSFPDSVAVEAALTVDHLSLEPPNSLFEVKIKSGTLVIDNEHNYLGRMPPLDDSSLDEFLKSPKSVVAMRHLTSWDRWRPFLIAMNVLLLIALIIVLIARRRHGQSRNVS